MSLEDNVKELTLAVNRLITALDVTTASVTPAPSEAVYEVELAAAAPKKAKPDLKAVPTKEVEVKEVPPEPDVEYTREKLKALCLDLVRKDPANRDKVKKIISSFDESTLMSDVADTNLPSLAKQLLALAS